MSNCFSQMFDSSNVELVQFQEYWRDGEHFTNACSTTVPTGVVYKCLDEKSNRKILLVGTPLGTVVVYERFLVGEGIIYNTAISKFIPATFKAAIRAYASLNQSDLLILLGTPDKSYKNIGDMINEVIEAARRYQKLFEGTIDDNSNVPSQSRKA